MTRVRMGAALAGAAIGLGSIAATAQAGDVRVVAEITCSSVGCFTYHSLQYTSGVVAQGAARLEVDLEGLVTTVRETGPHTTGPGCVAIRIQRPPTTLCSTVLDDPVAALADSSLFGVASIRVVGNSQPSDISVVVGPPVPLNSGAYVSAYVGGDLGGGDDTFASATDGTRVEMGSGDDRFFSVAGAPRSPFPNAIAYGGAGADALYGGRGTDLFDGGEGNDLLVARGGGDSMAGGEGDDVIQARNGGADRISCGAGADLAVVDAADAVNADCETVQVG